MTQTALHLDLLSVLNDARRLLEIPQNDFQYSPWHDRAAAVQEVDVLIAQLRAGQMPARAVGRLLSPTGPLQEVSMGSGWLHQFIELAVRTNKLLHP